MAALIAVVELVSFLRDVEGILTEEQREELKHYLAANPDAGVVIPGTGGVRKLRWAASGRGKRGGGRVIYYFHDLEIPLYLFKFFTKSAKPDLTAAEKKELAKVVETILEENRRRK